jgi:hypothetical protein
MILTLIQGLSHAQPTKVMMECRDHRATGIDREFPEVVRTGEVLWGYTKIFRDGVQGALQLTEATTHDQMVRRRY